MRLVGSIVLLSRLPGIKVILCLGHSVSFGRGLGPCLSRVSSTLDVKVSEILEDAGFLDVAFVVRGLLLVVSVTNCLVL